MKFSKIRSAMLAGIFFGLWFLNPTYASAQNCSLPGCYGIEMIETVNANLPTTTLGGGGPYVNSQSVGVSVPLNQTSDALSPIFYGNSVTAFDPIANGIYTASASSNVYLALIVDKTLHVWLDTSGATADPYLVDNGAAQAYLLWYDTLDVTSPSGAPPGTPVTLQVTNWIDGSIQLSGNTGGSQLTQALGLTPAVSTSACGAAELQNAFTTDAIFDSKQYFDLCTVVGATLTLTDYIQADLNGATQWSATANMQDSAVAYVDSLTPGATVTSASGIDYSTPVSATPEPSSFYLLAIGTLLIAARSRLKRW